VIFNSSVEHSEAERQESINAGKVVTLRAKRSSKAAPRPAAPDWLTAQLDAVRAEVTRRLPPAVCDEHAAARQDLVGILCAHHGYTLDQAIAEVLQREQHEKVAAIVAEKLAVTNAPGVASSARDYTTEALLDDYAKSRKARGRADATLSFIACHSKALRRLLPSLGRDIDHARLLGYIETRRAEGAGEVVRKEVHSVLRPALKLAYKSELFNADPAKVIPEIDSLSQPRERWLTVEEAWKVVQWLSARSKAGRDHAACVAFALSAGAEYAAWSRAKCADVRDDRKGAQVHGTKRKTRDRFAPAPLPEQQELLRFALDNASGSGGTLFTRWNLDNANTDLREACDALGIPRCSTNDLRRSYASWLGQAGVRDELIEKAMGHKGSSVLGRHYRKLTDEDLLRLMLDDLRKEQAELRTAEADLRIASSGPTDALSGPTGNRTRDRRIKNPQL